MNYIKSQIKKTVIDLLSKLPYELSYYAYLQQARHQRQLLQLPKEVTVSKRSHHRSVAFVGHCYYSFYYLAQALRRRGWDAISVSSEVPYPQNTFLYHGSDLDLYDPNQEKFKKNVESFLLEAVNRFDMVHFYGDSCFWPYLNYHLPIDFLFLKKHGLKMGFTPTGCLDGVLQSEVRKGVPGLCDKCIWSEHPEVCSDNKNGLKKRKIEKICDVIAFEHDWPLGIRNSEKGFSEPLTYVLDSSVWSPEIEIPEQYRIQRTSPEHLLVLTAFANQETRTNSKKDIKGSRYIKQALDRLIAEGYKIQHIFCSGVPSKDMRYIQAQADLVVDQLNYGRYGAFARESLMLGKPVISCLKLPNGDTQKAVREIPLIDASEENIYEVLKVTINRPREELLELGRKGREWALKWYDADRCAERFERMYDRLMLGQKPFDKSEFE